MSMQIALYLQFNVFSQNSGVQNKIFDHLSFWNLKGVKYGVFMAVHRDHNHTDCLEEHCDSRNIYVVYYRTNLEYFIKTFKLAAKMIKFKPDIVFCRYGYYHPIISFYKRLYCWILEVNTDDLWEYKLNGTTKQYYYNYLTRAIYLKSAFGHIYVTSELANRKHFAKHCQRRTVISNGINMEHITPITKSQKMTPSIIFAGNYRRRVHGVDKVISLARLKPEWDFHLAGVTRSELGFCPNNVTCYGVIYGDEYRRFIEKADIGLGPLAMHRYNINESCTLKVREYMAHGIPTIMSGKDVDFPGNQWFLLNLENCENNIESNLCKIDLFVKSCRNKTIPRQDTLHLDAKVKEGQRLLFFQQLLEYQDCLAKLS